jgi:hypothetical protein
MKHNLEISFTFKCLNDRQTSLSRRQSTSSQVIDALRKWNSFRSPLCSINLDIWSDIFGAALWTFLWPILNSRHERISLETVACVYRTVTWRYHSYFYWIYSIPIKLILNIDCLASNGRGVDECKQSFVQRKFFLLHHVAQAFPMFELIWIFLALGSNSEAKSSSRGQGRKRNYHLVPLNCNQITWWNSLNFGTLSRSK